MTAVEEGYLDHEGVRLHYLQWHGDAERRPAILALHGLSSNARIWERLAARLPGRRLVALDQRSHGPSDRPAQGYGAAQVVADAAHAIVRLDLGRPLIVGHSWGASIALELAATRPELAAGLVFVDGPAAAMTRLMTWEDVQRIMQPPLPRYDSYEEAERALAASLGAAYGPDLQAFVRAGLRHEDGEYRSALTAPVRLEILRAMYHYQPEALFPQVQGPVLLALAGAMELRSRAAAPGEVAPAEVAPVPAGTARQRWRREAAEAVLSMQPAASVIWYDSPHDIPLFRPSELAEDVERMAIAAGFWDVGWRAAGLDGDWSVRVHDEGEWSARQLLAHLASTQTALPQVLRTEPAQQTGEPFDPDRWNASQVRRRQGASPAALIEELLQASAALRAVLHEENLRHPAAIGPYAGRQLTEVMERMLAHQQTHVATLAEALRAPQTPAATTP